MNHGNYTAWLINRDCYFTSLINISSTLWEDTNRNQYDFNILSIAYVTFLCHLNHIYLNTNKILNFGKSLKQNNQLQNNITIYKKFITCDQKQITTLRIILSCHYIEFSEWVYLTSSFAIGTIINIDYRNDIVTLKLIITIILEGIVILQCLWIFMNRNRGFRLRNHLMNSFLNWLFHFRYFGRWCEKEADAALAYAADVEEFLILYLEEMKYKNQVERVV